MTADAQTIAFYDRDSAAYVDHVIAHGVRASLEAFEQTLPRNADVLDLGCGGGQDSAWLIGLGHRVASLDASAGLAREAKARFGIDVRVADFADLDETAAFDGVWAAAALHHAPAGALPGIVARIARALRPGGRLSTNLKAGDDRRDGLGRFYCAMDATAAHALFDPVAWVTVQVRETEGAGYDAATTPWLVITAQRR